MDVMIAGKKCERCGNEWKPQKGNENPERCPSCGSPYWNRPRKVKQDFIQDIKSNSDSSLNPNLSFVKCFKCKTNQTDISIDNNWYCLDCVTKYNLDNKNKSKNKKKEIKNVRIR